jgi:hypothetical protein
MSLSRARFLALLGFSVLSFFALTSLQAQGPASKGENVRIPTVDGVELHGTLYASPKKGAPTVILLHALDTDNSQKKGWVSLAETLQPNFSVMAFDFRGHGKSTTLVDAPLFWANPTNAKGVKLNPKDKGTINFKDFAKTYYPVLINDIAAVKAYLDRRNDAGVVNTASTFVIGAETGATLGAIWLNSEWHRYKLIPAQMFGFPPTQAPQPEGKEIIGAVWLSMSPTLGSRSVLLSGTLEIPCKQNATATVFIYGDQDTKGKDFAKAVEKSIKVKTSKQHDFIGGAEIKGTSLKGSGLLQKSLPTEAAIFDYLKNVTAERSNEPYEREFMKTQYVWRNPGTNVTVPARATSTDKNLVYQTYDKYLVTK